MSCTSISEHPDAIHTPSWDWVAKTPVVDGKIEDPKTGELRTASDTQYAGPPSVDMVIMSVHEDTTHCCYRSQRPFPVEKLLYQIMRVVHDRKLAIDSLTATTYAIRIVLAHELTVDEFYKVTDAMSNGIWHQV